MFNMIDYCNDAVLDNYFSLFHQHHHQFFLIYFDYLPKYLGKVATALVETVPVSKELKTIKYQARVSGRSQSSSSEIDDKHARIQRACQLLATNRLTIF